jgi:L-threonylcarbamoyladenylate synthase
MAAMTVHARILDAHDPRAAAEAAALVRAGGLVAFPTETVYGLGADAFDARAVARIFAVKGRPALDPLIVHVAGVDELPTVARAVPSEVERLAARFWPGPLTLVLPKAERVPDLVTSGLDSVGVRVPAHPAALALLRACGRPIAAPSANPFGYVSPTTAAHVADLLGERVDLILDGGPCAVGVESTILSLVADEPTILRPGGVPREALEAALGRRVSSAARGARPQAPGQLETHYATRTPLRLLDGPATRAPAERRTGLLAFAHEPPREAGYAAVEVLAPDGDLTTAAASLFAALRRLDARGLDALEAEPCPDHGLGHAILDRLRRAAAPRDEQ